MSSQEFDWPLERSLNERSEHAIHSANTVLAHFKAAFRNKKMSQMYAPHSESRTQRDSTNGSYDSSFATQPDHAIHNVLRQLDSYAADQPAELDHKTKSEFDAQNIRSLEMKFAAMMIS